jgi:reactive intermediate/imine deaminase
MNETIKGSIMKEIINTQEAPAAIGTYSQAVKVGSMVFISGQIPLNPITMAMVENDFKAEAKQVFANLIAVAKAAGGSLQDAVKFTVYLTDMANFAIVNEVMAEYCNPPFPARAVIAVSALPKGARIEIDAILNLALI